METLLNGHQQCCSYVMAWRGCHAAQCTRAALSLGFKLILNVKEEGTALSMFFLWYHE